MLPNQYWNAIKDGDPGAFNLYRTHYSYHRYRDNRRLFRKLFVGPGKKAVYVTQDWDALWVWRKFFDKCPGQTGINNAVFINRSKHLSSDLIKEAVELAWQIWPGERLYTYVDPRKVKSTNPGYCYLIAGWKKCGKTEKGLLILEKLPI